ncbi:MAG TPA: 16S rRNA (cytosine(1402)-N(4))-methyltransferase RsmH [Clostridiales bacterium]|nr:16S rRNA (cytosine(1402)-N(4))-methyltransferase RsmH [Clostridiales bacterium]
MSSYHTPVLLNEVISGLNIKSNGIYVDGTVGGGGHSREIFKLLDKNGLLICNDIDIEAIEEAKREIPSSKNIIYINDNYKNLVSNLHNLNIEKVDGVLLDLGVSSHQIDDAARGFSYMIDAPLDMRMSKDTDITAYDVVNGYSYEELVEILFSYGEEKYSRFIAKQIIKSREINPIKTTTELADITKKAYQIKNNYGSGHPAKKTFQAIRIEVNKELEKLSECIVSLTRLLKRGGRICIISFHSLEDRIVKQTFVELEKSCICDKMSPICTCNKKSEIEILTKKPLTASAKEIENNSRSKSAKLRIAQKK